MVWRHPQPFGCRLVAESFCERALLTLADNRVRMTAIPRRIWRRPRFLVVAGEAVPVAECSRDVPPRVLFAVVHVHRALIDSSLDRWPATRLPKRGGIVKRHASANEEGYPKHDEGNRANTGEEGDERGKKSLHGFP